MDRIPITIPLTGREEEEAAAEVIRSGWLTQGPRTAEFEQTVAAYVGAATAVATANCTAALILALEAVGVGSGDEVVTAPYSFIATANAIVARGAKPIFADIDLATYNLDPERAAEKITARTKALMPVDQLGLPCDLDAFRELASRHKVALVEDAACALGSLYKGRPVGSGSLNECACFSFHPRKLVTTGEGGMITTNDGELEARVRALISHGATVSEVKKHSSTQFLAPSYPVCGYNYRLSDILSAVGTAQMKRLDMILARRTELGRIYDQILGGHPRVVIPAAPEWAVPNRQSYQIRLREADREERNRVVDAMREKGVMATPGVADIHRQECYQRLLGPSSFPQAETAADTCLILPLFPQMSDDDPIRCAETLIEVLG
jgi:dTDP-4-amino-4,6-dideoxygalactose transaminase